MAPPLQYSCLENSMDGGAWWAAVHGIVKSQTRLNNFTFTFHFHALEKEMATHSSVLAWRLPGTGELGGLLSMGLHRVRHDWSGLVAAEMMWQTHHGDHDTVSQSFLQPNIFPSFTEKVQLSVCVCVVLERERINHEIKWNPSLSSWNTHRPKIKVKWKLYFAIFNGHNMEYD